MSHDAGTGEKAVQFMVQSVAQLPVVHRVEFNTHAVSPRTCGREARCSGSAKRIENGISYKAEHAHQTLSEFERIRRGVVLCGRAREARPDLLKPRLVTANAENRST